PSHRWLYTRSLHDALPIFGSSVERGGDTNGPAAVYSITKYVDWLNKYAPPNARGMTFSEAGPVPAQGNIAQQIFWYTAFTADMRSEEHTSELQSLRHLVCR